MGRPLRYVPTGGALVEVTWRTLEGRYLLRPSPTLNEILVGVLARAQHRGNIEVCAVAALSNHLHLLLHVEDAQQLADFMWYAGYNLAKEVLRLTGGERLWGRRYRHIIVSDEEPAQVARLRYLLAQGCKEDLVARPLDWPGVHAARPLLNNRDLHGYWFDRTAEYKALQRGESFERLTYAEEERLVLTPIPCWRHLAPATIQLRIAQLLEDIEHETKERRERLQLEPLGVEKVLHKDRHRSPENFKTTPAPDFHCASREAHQLLRNAYHWFVISYRIAAEKLRAGDLFVTFPEGSFPPPLPFQASGLSPPDH